MQKQFIVHFKLLIVAAIWGAGWAAGRIMALDIPPITGAWIRYLIAITCFLFWLKMIGGRASVALGSSLRPVGLESLASGW